jgi:hypothetical protein
MKKTTLFMLTFSSLFLLGPIHADNSIAERGGGDRGGGYQHGQESQTQRRNQTDAATHEYEQRGGGYNRESNNENNEAQPEVIVAPGYQAPYSSPGGYGN